MADFKIDTSAFTAVKTSYTEASHGSDGLGGMMGIVKSLNSKIEDLQNAKWKSDASQLFFQKYNNQWAENVKKYVAVIDCMSELIAKAQSSYENLAAEAEKLKY